MELKSLLLLTCLTLAQAQKCWNIQLQDPTLYCYGNVAWPLYQDVYYEADTRDAIAKKQYRDLITRWRARENPTDDPTNDCLAIARIVYCATQFPYCDATINVKMPPCDWICRIYSVRCPSEDQSICATVSTDATCTFARILGSADAIFIGLLLMLH